MFLNSVSLIFTTELNQTGIHIVSTDERSLTLFWELNSDIHESPVNVTVVANNVDGGEEYTCILGQARNATCADLDPGCNYTVKVNVQRGTFEGSVLTSASLVPASPGKLNTTLCGVFEAPDVTLCWDPSEGCVDYYYVYVTQSGGEVVFSTQTSDGANFTKVTNLTAGTEYNITIFAHSFNQSSASTLDTFITQPSEPSQQLNLSVKVLGKTEVKLNWESPKHPNGVISAYTLCFAYKHYWDQSYSETNCTNKTAPEMDVNGNHFKTNLSLPFAGTFYTFSVAALNEMFTGKSVFVDARTHESTPGRVTGLYSQATNTTITLMWSRPAVPNGDIIKYELQWEKGGKRCLVVIKADTQSTWVPHGESCGSELPEPIDLNQVDVNYTITALEHFKDYDLWLMPFTAAGGGDFSELKQRTLETSLGPVGNLTIRDIGSTAINVAWTIPEIKPGPTNYTAVARSTIPGLEHTARCEVEDYTSTGCEIESLREFWQYQVKVIAETKGGISVTKLSQPFYTEESTPGTPTSFQVQLLKDLTNVCDATKVTVTWSEPNLLNRNANITQYVVQTEQHNHDVFTYTVDDPKPFSRHNSQFSLVYGGLKANRVYQWQLYAVGRNGVKGKPAYQAFWTEECAPPRMDSHIEILEITSSSAIVDLDPNFFTNKIQGEIVKYGMVGGNGRDVVKKVYGNDVMNVGSWSNFTSNNNQGAYRFTFNLAPIVNGKLRLEVGQNKNCRKHDLENFCNGPLPSGLELWVKAYACTRVACTVSEHYGPFTIQQPHQDSNASGVDGGLIALPILIAILILISMFLVLWWRGAIDPLQWKWKKQVLGVGEEEQEQDTYQEIAEPDRPISC
ncbi:phosphatidylinositol phosphatase PTPRQ-like isoform X2 [Mya arenaria]|uniref:phosphatidylinositol phosphatase PTPRQ-like isoform X2 n=1 Tax=Mya arenaria TaxID=6604 RepID=UPI0022E3ABD2|nr:phosphatidylinositol phosphatase PTPRQ-like isoform X2 [Mya arenaria]